MAKKPVEEKKKRGGRVEGGKGGREVERQREREGERILCVCEEGQKLHAEVTADLSQSLQLFVESHGLQLGSPDTMRQEDGALVSSSARQTPELPIYVDVLAHARKGHCKTKRREELRQKMHKCGKRTLFISPYLVPLQ